VVLDLGDRVSAITGPRDVPEQLKIVLASHERGPVALVDAQPVGALLDAQHEVARCELELRAAVGDGERCGAGDVESGTPKPSARGKANRILGVKAPALPPVVTSAEVPLFVQETTSVTVDHEVVANENGPALLAFVRLTSARTV
jgi:hypothetical protein